MIKINKFLKGERGFRAAKALRGAPFCDILTLRKTQKRHFNHFISRFLRVMRDFLPLGGFFVTEKYI